MGKEKREGSDETGQRIQKEREKRRRRCRTPCRLSGLERKARSFLICARHCETGRWCCITRHRLEMNFYQQLNQFQVYRGNYTRLHSNYKYRYALSWERVEDPEWVTLTLQRYWAHSIIVSLLYYILIRVLQRGMRDRQAFSLQMPLFLWNTTLALFSTLGFLRLSEDVFHSLWTTGFYGALCYSCHPNDVAAFWSLLFAISKIIELGDTLFIVLRKRPLIFLHYYHHAAVLIYTVHAGAEHTAAGRVFMTMNYFAHSIMYTYYALTAFGFRVHKTIAMAVTTVQTAQMLAGVGVSFTVHRIMTVHGWPCQQSMANLHLAFLIYATFAFLFFQFFYTTYIVKKSTEIIKKNA